MTQLKVFIVILLLPLTLSAQRTISGRVTVADDGTPVPNASVFIDGTMAGTSANTEGYYSLTIPGPGSYRLGIVNKLKYQFG